MNIYNQIVNEILSADHIVITAHKSPDGDSVGSSLGLYHFIRHLNKSVAICHPDPVPDYLNWLENASDILYMEKDGVLVENNFKSAGLIFCLDYNSPERVGEEMQKMLMASEAKKIMIDHHLDPAAFTDFSFLETSSSSTAELICELIIQSGNLQYLDEKTGTPLYLGILTDSGGFRFPSVRPKTHEVLAILLKAGVKHHLVHERLNDTNTVDRLRLQGYALSEKLEVWEDLKVAIISLKKEELEKYKYQKGDTEGLVNTALSIKGIRAAVFLSEKDGIIKISFRSKGIENPVNILASVHFNGGGHANASGGMSELSMEATIQKLKELIPQYLPC